MLLIHVYNFIFFFFDSIATKFSWHSLCHLISKNICFLCYSSEMKASIIHLSILLACNEIKTRAGSTLDAIDVIA